MDDTTQQPPQISLADLFTTTIAFMKAAEAAYPEAGRGKDKFDTVMAQVNAFAPLVTLGLGFADKILPTFIAQTVALFNKYNIFKK